MRLSSKFQNLLVALFVLIAWYSVLFGFILSVKDSVISYMIAHNMTKFTLQKVVFNATSGQWVQKPEIIDIAGLIDLVLTLLMVFGPLIFAIKKIAR